MKMFTMRILSVILVFSALLLLVHWTHVLSSAVGLPEQVNSDHMLFLPVVDKFSIPGMIMVPAGEFIMGCYEAPGTCDDDNSILITVTLDDYYIDRYEVTNAQFADCVANGGCTPPSVDHSSTRLFYYGNPDFAHYPVLPDSWYQAVSYCNWAGKRLPTEAEWEKAARGNRDIRFFPWGDNIPDCTLANGFNMFTGEYCSDDTTQVGSYPSGMSQYGAMDMSGNVAEWVSDWYQADYYESSPLINPLGPETGTEKIIRGGSWTNGWIPLQVSDRWPILPETSYNFIGFRCALSVIP